MPSNKEHHYVPQFYLRNFAIAGERCVRAFLIDSRRHIERAPIRGQCHVPYLYGQDQVHERHLAKIEGDAAGIIRGLIDREVVPASDSDEMMQLATFMMLQRGRTPTAAALYEEQSTQFMRAMMRTHPAMDDKLRAGLEDVRLVTHGAVKITLTNALLHTPTVFDLRPKLICNETAEEFVTSDAPVALHNQWMQDIRDHGTLGLAMRGAQIFLPVSPRHLFVLYDAEAYAFGTGSGAVVSIRDPRIVKQLNALQVTFAETCLYYSRASSAGAIDALPWALRDPRSRRIGTHRYAANKGTSELIVSFERASQVRLAGLFRVHRSIADVPLNERISTWRPIAWAYGERIRKVQQEVTGLREGTPRASVYHRVPDE